MDPSASSISSTSNSRMSSTSSLDGSQPLLKHSAEIASMTQYIFHDVTTIFTSSETKISHSSASRVLIILFLFLSLWASAFLLLFLSLFLHSHSHSPQTQTHVERRAAVGDSLSNASAADESDDLQLLAMDTLKSHIMELFPEIYRVESPTVGTMVWEIAKFHPYLSVTPLVPSTSVLKRVVSLTELLTHQSLVLFALIICFNLQAPADDGTCKRETAARLCLGHTSALDSAVSICAWDDTSSTCAYEEPAFSLAVMMYCTTMVTVIISIVSVPLQFAFAVLYCPR
jgi:hypothetical protein